MPHAPKYCAIALSFFANQDGNDEHPSHESGFEDVECNIFYSYYDDAYECDDTNIDVYERR